MTVLQEVEKYYNSDIKQLIIFEEKAYRHAPNEKFYLDEKLTNKVIEAKKNGNQSKEESKVS